MRKLVVLVSVALLLLTAAGSASATHKWAIQWCEEEVDAWLVDTETVGLRFFSAGIRKAPVSQGPMIPSLGWGNLIVAFTAYTGFVEWAYEYRLSSSLEHVGGLAMVYDESAGDYWIVVAAESAEGLVLVTLDMRDGAVVSVRSYVAEGGTITPGDVLLHTNNDEVFVVGRFVPSSPKPGNESHVWVGEFNWYSGVASSRTYDHGLTELGTAAAVLENDRLFVAANYLDHAYDLWFLELDSTSGGVLFSERIGGSDSEQATSVAAQASGNLVITGASREMRSPNYFPFVLNYKPGAGTTWATGYTSSQATTAWAYDIAVCPTGDLTIAGSVRMDLGASQPEDGFFMWLDGNGAIKPGKLRAYGGPGKDAFYSVTPGLYDGYLGLSGTGGSFACPGQVVAQSPWLFQVDDQGLISPPYDDTCMSVPLEVFGTETLDWAPYSETDIEVTDVELVEIDVTIERLEYVEAIYLCDDLAGP